MFLARKYNLSVNVGSSEIFYIKQEISFQGKVEKRGKTTCPDALLLSAEK